jgi:hypothetical protein
MDSIQETLREFVTSSTALGPSKGRKHMLERLRKINAANARYFNMAAVMLVAAFVVALYIIYRHGGDKVAGEAVVGTFGATTTGMTWMMLRFWREKVRTEMLIELGDLDPGILREVALRFLKSVGGDSCQPPAPCPPNPQPPWPPSTTEGLALVPPKPPGDRT